MRAVGISLIIAVFFIGILLFSGMMQPGDAERKGLTIGERFHDETSLTWSSVLGDLVRSKPRKPAQYKKYPGVKVLQLPEPNFLGMPLEDAIRKRRSVREYSTKPITPEQLSQILFAAQGRTGSLHGRPLRSAPSAGALYPFEMYLFIHNVRTIPRGIYHYSLTDHTLELLRSGDFRSEITSAGLKQEMLGDSCVTFVLSALFDRVRHKYGERGFRYVYMEAGHISQNISLQAVSMGLGSVSVGAFIDKRVNQLIGVDGLREAAIYLHAVGSL